MSLTTVKKAVEAYLADANARELVEEIFGNLTIIFAHRGPGALERFCHPHPVTLEKTRFEDGGRLFLHRVKTGVSVYVLHAAARHPTTRCRSAGPNDRRPKLYPRSWFWTGNHKPSSRWPTGSAYRRLFDAADICKADGKRKRRLPQLTRRIRLQTWGGWCAHSESTS